MADDALSKGSVGEVAHWTGAHAGSIVEVSSIGTGEAYSLGNTGLAVAAAWLANLIDRHRPIRADYLT